MLPLNPARIPSLYKEAQALQRRGKAGEARRLYHQILGVKPKQAEVHYQLGRIALAEGDAAGASAHFDDAAAIRPGEVAIWKAQAQAVARLDGAARQAFLEKVGKAPLHKDTVAALQDRLAPKSAAKPGIGQAKPAEVRAAVAALEAGRPAEAERKARALRKAHPRVAVIADILAGALAGQGKTTEAEESFVAAIALDPDYAEGRANYGRFLIGQGRLEEGIEALRAALDHSPGMPGALLALGAALSRKGDSRGAVTALQRAVAERPDMAEAQARLGIELLGLGEMAAAAEALQAAADLGDARAATLAHLGAALAGAGREEAALAAYGRALAADPERALSHGGRAHLLQRLGRFEEAEEGFRRAIALDPGTGAHYRIFAASRRMQSGDPLLCEMDRRFAEPALSEENRIQFGFALAKAMSDTGAHGRVFAYLRPANEAMRARQPFDFEARRREIDSLKAAFSDTDFTARRIAGASDYAPVFVTGMPRSGTTLVEQILASHPRVTGAGEAGVLSAQAWRGMTGRDGRVRRVADLADSELRAIGTAYESVLRSRFPDADLVADKSIQTYLMIGLVRLVLPAARVIVVRRDPRDTALSIYKNLFAEGTHRYAYDLGDIGRYHRLHDEMLDFWRARLPGGFHEIRYERLIAEPEPETRALVAAAGLDWDPACLRFHETARPVGTLSLYQVRQPLSAGSVGAWRRHEDELGELFEALDEG